ncbi:hypothetical protein BIU96_11075 [Curtobacterium sp. MCBA15_008]|nr:hypothetical protein BIU96_11075 [Curtobacterium sp. MCBA15_008]
MIERQAQGASQGRSNACRCVPVRAVSILQRVTRFRERRTLERFAVACIRLDDYLTAFDGAPTRYGTLAVAATELIEHGWIHDDLRDLGVAGMRPRPWPTGKAEDAGADVPSWVANANPLADDVEKAALSLRAL